MTTSRTSASPRFRSERYGERRLAAVAVISLVALLTTVWAAIGTVPDRGYREGEIVRGLPPSTIDSDADTILVWFNRHCAACLASLDFYGQLTSIPAGLSVVFVARSPVEDTQAVLVDAGVSADRVVSIGEADLGFRQTPKVLLVNAEGRVRRVWHGRLPDSEAEHAALAEIAVLAGSAGRR